MQGCKTNTIVDERDGLLKELADRAWAGARPHLWEQQDAGPLLLDHRPSPDPSAEKPQDDFSSMENLGWRCHALQGSYLATLLPKRFITKTLIMLALRGGAFSSSPTPDAGTPGADDRCGAARAPTLSVRSAASTQECLETALFTGPLRDSAGPAGGGHRWTVLSREPHTGNFWPEWLPGGSLGVGRVAVPGGASRGKHLQLAGERTGRAGRPLARPLTLDGGERSLPLAPESRKTRPRRSVHRPGPRPCTSASFCACVFSAPGSQTSRGRCALPLH
ncbi:unnamed protein product [Rangifer tarandus platyrhynchus]|uniref:Uncharacterized protein n=1 Tax=Rangifer tarandus platyrhynchus TaxID=3082113 RepID=A0ABN8Z5J2_RANTA|nr:unnamed protein product [Rangifer tarandus platyrhynchus]